MAGKAKYDPLEAAKLGTDAPKVSPPPPVAVAVEDDLDEPVVAPAPARRPRYTLKADKRCSVGGQIIDFKAGRIFDSAGYDIEGLRRQGCDLELVKE